MLLGQLHPAAYSTRRSFAPGGSRVAVTFNLSQSHKKADITIGGVHVVHGVHVSVLSTLFFPSTWRTGRCPHLVRADDVGHRLLKVQGAQAFQAVEDPVRQNCQHLSKWKASIRQFARGDARQETKCCWDKAQPVH